MICDNLGKLDSRIVIIHQANKGVSYSRNIGIKKAKGKWITFVDSDDWLDENYLQLLISYCKNDDVDIVTSGLIWWYSESNINKEILNPSCCLNFDNEDDFIQFLTQPLITSPVGKLYRRDILISNGVFLMNPCHMEKTEILMRGYRNLLQEERLPIYVDITIGKILIIH